MSDLIVPAAQALVPFAGAAAGAMAEELGKEVAESAGRLLTRLKQWFHKPEGDADPAAVQQELEQAIRLALIENELSKPDLREFIEAVRAAEAQAGSSTRINTRTKVDRNSGQVISGQVGGNVNQFNFPDLS